MHIRLLLTAKEVVRPLKILLIISTFLLCIKIGYSQQNIDSTRLKKEIDSAITAIMKRHGLKNAGFTLNVISLNQQGGQTAYQITNNYYTGIRQRHLSLELFNEYLQYIKENAIDSICLTVLSYDQESENYGTEIGNAIYSRGIKRIGWGYINGTPNIASMKYWKDGTAMTIIIPPAPNVRQ